MHLGPRSNEPFPVEAARDLLGLVRSLYRATPKADAKRRDKLQAIGVELKLAIELGAARVGSLGHRAAWTRAETALAALADVVVTDERSEAVMRAAGDALASKK